MVIRLPLDPYWHNAATWWLENVGFNQASEYDEWLAEQGVVGMPRAVFTNYLEYGY